MVRTRRAAGARAVGVTASALLVDRVADYYWMPRMHYLGGHLALADGSVHKTKDTELRRQIHYSRNSGGNTHIQKP